MPVYPLANSLLPKIIEWRRAGYPGVTEVTRDLLGFWFESEHYLPDGRPFRFWACQREAIETLIYLFEGRGSPKIGTLADELTVDMGELFGLQPPQVTQLKLIQEWMEKVAYQVNAYDPFPKYALRMATGSGKTMVMAMTMAWLYLNGYSSHFLVLCPNLIVLERLILGFRDSQESASIFSTVPIVPLAQQAEFHPQVIVQDETENEASPVLLYVTNIQQLYDKGNGNDLGDNPVQRYLRGLEPTPEEEAVIRNSLLYRLAQKRDLVIFNDEAHHVHDPELLWAQIIDVLHQDGALKLQLDFSATPKTPEGKPFPHTVYNYPLKRAIDDRIVKGVTVATLEGARSALADTWLEGYRPEIDEGVRQWQAFRERLADGEAKPVLFIMADSTRHADEVARYLETRHDLAGRVLTIHTNAQGDIYQKDLELARQAARQIDRPDNPYDVIVSVLMLKEGWDVKNVNIIVPLRKADSPILVEQTLGRGLRRVFPPELGVDEELVVIEHPRFRLFWEAEIREGDLNIRVVSTRQVQPSETFIIRPLPEERGQYDIVIPILHGGIILGWTVDVGRIDMAAMPAGSLRLSDIDLRLVARSRALVGGQEEREERQAPFLNLYQLVLADITKLIVTENGLTGSYYAPLGRVIDRYIKMRLFKESFNPLNQDHVHKLQTDGPVDWLRAVFKAEIEKQTAREVPYSPVYDEYRLSQTKLWPTSQAIYEAQKTIFSGQPYPRQRGELEKAFMRYLDDQSTVLAWSKIFGPIPFRVAYSQDGIHYYTPDFVAVTEEANYLIETKGEGFGRMENVPAKKEVAVKWCENATRITGQRWEYRFVLDELFRAHTGMPFEGLMALAAARLLA
jgi:type III restriction enzyme